jgi:hypothetical protein
VVASALLDLLTAAELAAVLRACAGHPVLFALTVVGRVSLDPPHALDARVEAAFNAHQRRDGLLGPDAANQVQRTCADVVVRPSAWRLGAADAELTAAWLDGWLAAACEQDPGLELDAYHDRRLAQAAAGELTVTVGHADLLVTP